MEERKQESGGCYDRKSIPPPFTVSTKELYSIIDAWVKDGIVMLPKCKHEPTKKEK